MKTRKYLKKRKSNRRTYRGTTYCRRQRPCKYCRSSAPRCGRMKCPSRFCRWKCPIRDSPRKKTKKSRKNNKKYKLVGGADGTPIKDINLQLLAGETIPRYMMGYGEFNQPQPCGSVPVLNTNTRCTVGSGPAQVGGG